MFRFIGWIPEIISVNDIGDPEMSFDKLKDNFNSGHLMLFYKDPESNIIFPIIEFKHDLILNQRQIKTVKKEEKKINKPKTKRTINAISITI